jgi:hypothetical protein
MKVIVLPKIGTARLTMWPAIDPLVKSVIGTREARSQTAASGFAGCQIDRAMLEPASAAKRLGSSQVDDDRIQASRRSIGGGNTIARGGTIFPPHAIVRNDAD